MQYEIVSNKATNEYRETSLAKSRIIIRKPTPQCGFSGRAIQILKACGVDPKTVKTVNVLEDDGIRQGIKEYSNWPTIPQLYIKGEFIGGSDIMMEMYESGELAQTLGKS